ncbi:Holliday junction endonuclease RuvC [Acetomicrobium mobile DSM 13181]|uniref:Crossover junction endodeoxyribonuclease RuvC n=1 Tax=Acetomicrobium mobile (strain ATCC BAA-54 / DSM 13181 / JCM 12221 / NGA) TaxID=891968 RepID=I4BVP4_ACEMN|nr:crossover junction endodeoxyribonuclease RuvC [Acetomicrobium mobile]AFM21351.1 Holliday junction endonuclease RuvC [Acetomicrobium mobile DSM 13181]
MLCLGIDPGIGRVGFGFVEERGSKLSSVNYGCIDTDSHLMVQDRLSLIYEELKNRVKTIRPDVLAMERLFFGQNLTTAENVWQARGVILLVAAQEELPVVELTPSEVKMAVCGYGKASKSQVQEMVRCILSLESVPKPDDTADALAVAIAGISIFKVQRLAEGKC